MVKVHIFNQSTWRADKGRSLQDAGQPCLHSESETSQGYTVRPSLKNKNRTKTKEGKTKSNPH